MKRIRQFFGVVGILVLVSAVYLWVELQKGDSIPTYEMATQEFLSVQPQLENRPAAARCRDYQPLRKALFGDLHIHTAFSQDASTQGTRSTPFDAYRFARGERLGVQPFTRDGQPTRQMQLQQPLDFAAVTDHAEQIGEVKICATPSLPGYDSNMCKVYRRWPRAAFFMMNTQANSGMFEGRFGFCGEAGEECLKVARDAWQENIAAAEIYNDTSENCEFTGLVAYEWTAAQQVANLHRNVIFANASVPDLPVSFYEARTAQDLWQQLDEQCNAENNCDYVVIPHNSNLSDGLMFRAENADGSALNAAQAERRARKEPIMEVMQHKGASECYFAREGAQPGYVPADELCDFEQLPYRKFSAKFTGLDSGLPTPDAGYLREVLRDGLQVQQEIGVNPFKLGVIGSTDTHLGTAGYTSESDFKGHGGAGMPASATKAASLPDDIEFNPGGLAVVWAEENSRESIFAALQRREVYGTSGPRMELRVFGGWDYDEGLCGRTDMIVEGYRTGIPMGGDLPARPHDAAAPTFIVSAMQDVHSEPLQRLQIIKGWIDADGQPQERVYDIAGNANNGASVNEQTCETRGPGYGQLCSVWKDPDFDASLSAWYYTRVVENPSCRWHAYICNANQVQCDGSTQLSPGLAACCDTDYSKTIQERAWSSPIWYTASP